MQPTRGMIPGFETGHILSGDRNPPHDLVSGDSRG